MRKLIQSTWFEWICLTAVLLLFSFLYVHVNTQGTYVLQDYRQGSYYTQLAFMFQRGQLGLTDNIGGDWAFFNGKYYLYHGPFPAVVWLFIKTFFREFSMSFLSLFMLVVNLLLFYLLLRKVSIFAEFDKKKAIWARFIFLFVYGLGIPYFLAGKMFVYETSITFGSTCMLGSLLLYLDYYRQEKRKITSIGITLFFSGLLLSFAFLSRINLLLSFIPFLGFLLWNEYMQNRSRGRDFFKSWFLLTCFMLPICISLVSYGFYNVARFGNPVDFGVSHLTTSSDDDNMRLKTGKATSIHYGLLNLMQTTILLPYFDTKPSYINYTAPSWLVGPFPRLTNVEYGGSLFFSSPMLLFLFVLPFFWKKLKPELMPVYIFIIVLFLSVATYSYFFMGFTRRYHQDYYPLLTLFALSGFYLLWESLRNKKALQTTLGIFVFLSILWTVFLAVHLNCIHTYYGHFDRCLDLKQPMQWFQPLS